MISILMQTSIMPLSFTYNFPQVSIHASILILRDTWIFGNGFNGVFTGE
jgi:hypothetical protein